MGVFERFYSPSIFYYHYFGVCKQRLDIEFENLDTEIGWELVERIISHVDRKLFKGRHAVLMTGIQEVNLIVYLNFYTMPMKCDANNKSTAELEFYFYLIVLIESQFNCQFTRFQ